jgi:hypothetical protein
MTEMTQINYMLRFPFKPLHWVTGLDIAYTFVVDNLQCSLSAEQPYLVIRVQPFSSEQEALAFIPRLWGALAWISVELRTGFIAKMQPDSVTYVDDPLVAARNLEKSLDIPDTGPVHGTVNGHMPAAIPLEKNIRAWKLGEITATVTYPINKYAPSFSRALDRSSIASLYNDEKLRTAIELLSDSQRESSLRSKFLTCITALEVLANPVLKHEVAQRLLSQLNDMIQEQMSIYQSDTNEHHALESLQRELIFRREASLRSSIRKLVLDGLTDLTENDRVARSREAVWAYDFRGSLVHDGIAANAELHRAHDIAYQTLIDLLARRIGLS